MKSVGHVSRIILGLFVSATLAGCGGLLSPTTSEHSQGSAINSACATDLMQQFALSYRPMLQNTTTCAQCHSDSGVSPFKLASSDLSTAFSTFMQLGADQVDTKALDPSHASGVTGPAMSSQVQSARALWDPAYAAYQTCLGAAGAAGAVRLENQNDPNLYFGDGRTETLTWDTSGSMLTPGSSRFPGQFSIDVHVNYQTINGAKVAVGYAFSNPKLQILTGTQQADLNGLVIYINDVQAKGIEPFLSATAIAKGIDPVTVYNGTVNVALDSVSSGDKIGIGFANFALEARTDHPPTPPQPTITPAVSSTNQAKVNVSISGDSTARRWCLTASSAIPASTAVACPGFENNLLTNGWQTSRPTSFDLTLAGALVSGQTVKMYLWVANSDLIISAQAATAQVVFDTTAPAAPALTSVNVTTTQIADLIGLGDSNESVSWCVKDASTMKAAQSSTGCKFSAGKPAYVGMTGGGINYVAVYVKDVAGNITGTSVMQANNPFGQITYAQLTDATTGDRAVIAKNCASCHGAGGTDQSFWDETSYADTVAKKSLILDRIENTTTPMPATGLMDAKSRALIELWFSQTSIPVQQ